VNWNEFASVVRVEQYLFKARNRIEKELDRLESNNVDDYSTKAENKEAKQEIKECKNKLKLAQRRLDYIRSVLEERARELDQEIKDKK
jgi:peptidoglycan hydrolase CwlO-like protein